MPFNHQWWMDKFAKSPGYNDAKHLGVTIEKVPGATARCVGIHVLTNEENIFDHNAQLAVIDPSGQRIFGSVVLYDWEGRRPDERADPVYLDKPEYEPPGNLGLGWNQTVELWVRDEVSDIVRGVHTRHPAIAHGDANHEGHWSFFIVWMIGGDPVVIEPPASPDVTEIVAAMKEIEEDMVRVRMRVEAL